MRTRSLALSTLAAAALVSLPLSIATAAPAAQNSVLHFPAVVGAMNESHALARSSDEVRRQGGFATAGSVRWLTSAHDGLSAF